MGSASKNFGLPQGVNDALKFTPFIGQLLAGTEAVAKTGAAMENKPKDAQAAQTKAEQDAASQANQLQTTLLSQPKTITPDNFLAMKSRQLANLRLGLASTITGGGNAPGPVLGSTALSGNYPGKTRLGQ